MADQPPKSDGRESPGQPTSRRDFFRGFFRGRPGADSERGASLGEAIDLMKESGRAVQRMTRRKAFKVLAGTAAALAGAYATFVEPGPTVLRDLKTPDDYDEATLKQIDFLEQRYGCDIELGIPMPIYGRLGQLKLQEKKEALTLLQEELAKYPPDYLRRLNPVIILTHYKSPFLAGIASRFQGRCFMVVGMDGEKDVFRANIIHHELEHIADFVDGAEATSALEERLCTYRTDRVKDEEWVRLNPEGRRAYAGRLWPIQAARDVFVGKWPRDFARFEGTQDPKEDQGTVAGMLMTMREMGNRKPILENFPVLAVKVAKVKSYMLRRSGGRMNDQYWKDLEAGKVDEKYWETH